MFGLQPIVAQSMRPIFFFFLLNILIKPCYNWKLSHKRQFITLWISGLYWNNRYNFESPKDSVPAQKNNCHKKVKNFLFQDEIAVKIILMDLANELQSPKTTSIWDFFYS